MSTQRKPADEVQYWLQYISCATRHPRPLPRGKHAYVSSLDVAPEVRDLYHCLYKLYTEENSSISFREPVNALSLGVFNYYDVVTTPMCLRTILDRIAGGAHYSTAAQVMADVQLIWQNCERYNGATAAITAEAHQSAAALERLRAAYADDQLAPADEVDRVVEVIESVEDGSMLEALMAYFKAEDPGMVDQGDLELSKLKVKHIRAMKKITSRYVGQHGGGGLS